MPEMHAMRADALTGVVAEEGLGRGEPDELDAFFLGVAGPRAASPACSRGRGDRGSSPRRRPGAPRCARNPSPYRRRRSRRRACRRRPGRRCRNRHTRRQAPAVRGDEVVQGRHDACRARCPGRRVARLVDAGGDQQRVVAPRSSARLASRPTSRVEVEAGCRRRARSLRGAHDSFSSLKLGMP